MKYEIGFLGLGKMGSSILNGIIFKSIYPREAISFYAPSEKTKNKGKELGIALASNEVDLVSNARIIILAIEPQKYSSVFSLFKDLIFANQIVVSLAPGKSINSLSDVFKGARIVRAMPNTPCLIGKGVTTLAFDKDEIKEVSNIFSSIGIIEVVKEDEIDKAIPLQGSMPAFIYTFVNAFIECAEEYGLDKDTAKKLALNAIIGSCELALNVEDDLDTLINRVCSPGGSTYAGLTALNEAGFKEAIKKCYISCVKRSQELGNN